MAGDITRIAVVDTETTGLSVSRGDRICDFGGVILDFEGFTLKRISKHIGELINPGFRISPLVSSVHHISNLMVKDAMTYDNLTDEVQDFFNLSCKADFFGAYNIKFDWDFLVGLHPMYESIQKKKVCFMKTTQKHYPTTTNHKLQFIRYEFNLDEFYIPRVLKELNKCRYLALKRQGILDESEFQMIREVQAHRALGDVVVTSALLLYMIENIEVDTWEDFFNTSNVSPDSPMSFGKHKGKALQWIFENDSGYVSWLLKQKDMEYKNPEMVSVFKTLLESKCKS